VRPGSVRGCQRSQAGLTLVETVIAMAMLVVFTATVASVLSFTQRFLRQSESLDGSDTLLADLGSKGLLVDQHELQLVMDALVDELQQPGWSADDLLAIAGDPQRRCSYTPVIDWGLIAASQDQLPERYQLPPRYRICLRATSLTEPIDVVSGDQMIESAVDQMTADPPAPPGIYVLQALPDQLDASTLPARRLFCRPRPFC